MLHMCSASSQSTLIGTHINVTQDPVYVGGHWTPQLIEMAGGLHPLNPPKSKTEGGDDGGGKVDSAVFFRARDAKCGAKLASVGASRLR